MAAATQCRVLLVDENDDFAFRLHQALFQRGVENVESAPTTKEAARAISGLTPSSPSAPDAIFLGLKQGENSGLDFLAWLRRSFFKKVPVLVFTEFYNNAEREKIKEFGVKGYFEKPGNEMELGNLVRTALVLCDLEGCETK